MDRFECVLPSWNELENRTREIAKKIERDNFQPDMVIALSRGGVVPARIICDSLIIKDLVSIKIDHWGITATKDGKAHLRYPLNTDLSGKDVLIVDDITDTGESMITAREFVKKLNPKEIRTATIFHIKNSKFIPDYYSREIEWIWVIWPWNYHEDLCNITTKILKDNDSSSSAEIMYYLKERFNIEMSEQKVEEIMTKLAERCIVIRKQDGWRLIKK